MRIKSAKESQDRKRFKPFKSSKDVFLEEKQVSVQKEMSKETELYLQNKLIFGM